MRRLLPFGRKVSPHVRWRQTLHDYLFLDRQRIDSYVEQLGGLAASRRKSSNKFSFSIKGPSVETSEEDLIGAASYEEKTEFLLRRLQKKGLLQERRPYELLSGRTDIPSFILEETSAVPVTIPKSQLPPELDVAALKIWIADPNPDDLDGPEWFFRGSFLYLTELIFDNAAYHSLYSGCSALQFIANATTGVPLLTPSQPEKLGRDNADHPIDKLRPIGAVKGDTRRIQVLYRIRYMTNEQVYTREGKVHRVHDILGYPLFIAV
jgi:hypothetical protein